MKAKIRTTVEIRQKPGVADPAPGSPLAKKLEAAVAQAVATALSDAAEDEWGYHPLYNEIDIIPSTKVRVELELEEPIAVVPKGQ